MEKDMMVRVCTCKTTPVLANTGFCSIDCFQVRCQKCLSMGPMNPASPEQAVEDWNKLRGGE